MTFKEKKYYDRIRARFIGRKVIQVYYEELNYDSDAEFWEYTSEIHCVDMNVIFQFDNNDLIQIKWDDEFYCYGIGFEELKKIEYRKNIKTIKLTENKNWKELIKNKISEITVFWDISEGVQTVLQNHSPTKNQFDVRKIPQTWQIEFGSEKIWISALEIKDGETSSYWADHLTVLFTNQGQEKFELIKNSRKQNTII